MSELGQTQQDEEQQRMRTAMLLSLCSAARRSLVRCFDEQVAYCHQCFDAVGWVAGRASGL